MAEFSSYHWSFLSFFNQRGRGNYSSVHWLSGPWCSNFKKKDFYFILFYSGHLLCVICTTLVAITCVNKSVTWTHKNETLPSKLKTECGCPKSKGNKVKHEFHLIKNHVNYPHKNFFKKEHKYWNNPPPPPPQSKLTHSTQSKKIHTQMLNQGNSNIYTPTFVRVQEKTRKRPNHLPLIQGKKVSEKNTAHWLKELLNENVHEKADVPSSVFFSSPSSFLSSTATFSFRSSCSTRTTYIMLQGGVGSWGRSLW